MLDNATLRWICNLTQIPTEYLWSKRRLQATSWKGLLKIIFLLQIFVLPTTGRSFIAISDLEECRRDHEFDRAVNDNVSPWTVHLYKCTNIDPQTYWSVECRRGSCYNPVTGQTLDDYTIKPIRRMKKFRRRVDGSSGNAFVTIACKCVPNQIAKTVNPFEK